MPYFKWSGCTDEGLLVRGTMYARNEGALYEHLALRGILSVVSVPLKTVVSYGTLMRERTVFFEQLSTLISARVVMVDALRIAAQAVQDTYVRCMVSDCADALEEGILLSESAHIHNEFFTPFAARMIMAGEQVGNLAVICSDLASYYRMGEGFMQKLRAALIMPVLTLMLFAIMVLGMFYLIIPRFAEIFASLPGPLPPRTEFLIAVSMWLRSGMGMATLGVGALIMITLVWYVRTRSSLILVHWADHIPGIRSGLRDLAAATFFQTLGSLLQGGVSMAQALEIALLGVGVPRVQMQYRAVVAEVIEGIPLSEACERHVGVLVPAVLSLIKVGEETGTLGRMITLAAGHYQQCVLIWGQTIGTFVQPVLILILGFSVAMLMIILYEPILAMGAMVS